MTNPSMPIATDWPGDELPAVAAPLRVNLLRKIVLWTVGAYLILNVGFEFVRIPPVGPGIPVGEIVLAISLLVISSRILLPIMAREVWMLPIVIWWGLTLSRVLFDARGTGIWAFRDGSQAIESLYLIVGFWFAGTEIHLEYFVRWLRRLLAFAALYGLLYPISDKLQNFSPKVSGIGTGAAPLIFSMTNVAVMLLWCAAWLLIDRPPRAGIGRDLFAAMLIATAVAFGQSRSTYLQVLVLGGALLLVRRKAAVKWIVTLLIGAVLIGAISVSGFEIKGREGETISLDFIAQHFESISSSRGGADVEAASAGVPLRINWWRHILSQLESSPQKLIFGLGYGMPLTTFMGRSSITREPHNSFISVIGRNGVSGFLMWTLMQVALYFSWWRAFRLSRRMQWTEDQVILLIIFVFCLMTLVEAVGEAAMEVPFYAIPYYFFFGVVLRYGRHLRQTAEQQSIEEREAELAEA
jgi:O-antigen ligase